MTCGKAHTLGIEVNWFPPKKVRDKMVSGDSGSFAMELYNALHEFPFRGMVSFIHKSSSMTRKEFAECELSEKYWPDTHNCKCGRMVNKQCVFKLFSTFSNEDAVDV